MKTLTEREMSRYLGTGVKVRQYWETSIGEDFIIEENDFTLEFKYYADILQSYKDNDKPVSFKLILHPLSDLTKPCLEGGKVPIVELLKLFANKRGFPLKGSKFREDKHWVLAYSTNSHLNIDLIIDVCIEDTESNPYWIIQQLHAWHFDTGLNKDLWLDINTISKEQNEPN